MPPPTERRSDPNASQPEQGALDGQLGSHEPVHCFRNETGAIACSDADSPYVAELTDNPARVTCAPCRESIADSPRRSLAPTNSLDAALDELDWSDPGAIPLENFE